MFSKQGQLCFGLSREQRKITKLPWEELLFDSSSIYHFSETVLSKITPRWCIGGTFPWKVHVQINILFFVTWWLFQWDCIMFFFPWRLEKNIYHTTEIPGSLSVAWFAWDLQAEGPYSDLKTSWSHLQVKIPNKTFSGVQNCSVHHQTVRVWFFVPIYKLSSKMKQGDFVKRVI